MHGCIHARLLLQAPQLYRRCAAVGRSRLQHIATILLGPSGIYKVRCVFRTFRKRLRYGHTVNGKFFRLPRVEVASAEPI
jgi:hypothetical protein